MLKGSLNRRRLSSVNGGLVDRIGETPTRAAIRFNRVITGDASPVIQASKKPPPRNANNAAAASIIVWRLGGIPVLNRPQILSALLLGATKSAWRSRAPLCFRLLFSFHWSMNTMNDTAIILPATDRRVPT